MQVSQSERRREKQEVVEGGEKNVELAIYQEWVSCDKYIEQLME